MISLRKVVDFYEAHAKKHVARDILIVGVRDAHVVKMFLSRHFLLRSLDVIASFDPPETLHPRERLQQHAASEHLQRLARAYAGKFRRLIMADPLAGVGQLSEGADYDLIIVGDAVDADKLAAVGAALVPLVRTGGYLVGRDHRVPAVRGILDSAVGRERWRAWPREGIWTVQVTRRGDEVVEPADDEPVKRKRGRPRKDDAAA